MEVSSPRKKPFAPSYRPSYPPLPGVKEDACVDDDYFKPCFHGCFNGLSVVVDDRWEMSALHNMGFFGKGSLSRSYPLFGKQSRGIPPVLKESQWTRRQQWLSELKSVFKAIESQTSLKTGEPGLSTDKDQGELNLSFSPDKTISLPDEYPHEVFVIKDSVDDDSEGGIQLNPRLEVETERIVAEVLQLTLEEAFFLSYGLGCLEVTDLKEKTLGIAETWQQFKKAQNDFVESYVVYHHFRSKGWVVKPGLKFGGKFLLYKKGPSYYHASYVVIIRNLDKPGSEAKSFTWRDFMWHNRMVEASNKDVLICDVRWPSLVDSPADIKEFTIQESLARRWLSSDQEMETKKDQRLKETIYDIAEEF